MEESGLGGGGGAERQLKEDRKGLRTAKGAGLGLRVVGCVEVTITTREEGPDEGGERGLNAVYIASSLPSDPPRVVRMARNAAFGGG